MGFRPKPRTRVITADWFEPDEGSDPLSVTIATNLTFDEVDALTTMLASGSGTTFAELFDAIADRVVSWNIVAIDRVSGEERPVPPPAEIGAKAFHMVDPLITNWIAWKLATIYRDDPEREGKPTPVGDTGAPTGVESSTSQPPTGTAT